MKTNRLFAAFMAVVSLLFVGCKPEQSELSIESLKEKTQIQGTILYDAGVDINSDDAYMVNNIVPAAQRKVFVEVPYSELGANAASQGNKVYETMTDSLGNFSLEIPTTPIGIKNVKVRMQEFVTARSEYKRMEADKPVFETKLYKFTWVLDLANEVLKPGTVYAVQEMNQRCAFDLVEAEGLEETITFEGVINVAYETEYRTGAYKKLANTPIVFSALYSLPDLAQTPIEFGTTTDAEGRYSITLPVEDYEKGFVALDVRVKGLGATYKHFYEVGKSMELSGAYQANNILANKKLVDIIEGMKYRMPEQFLKFTPNYNNHITENGALPTTWANNLAGWERYDGYNTTATITGQMLYTTEASYGIGTFGNPKQEAQIVVEYGDNIRGNMSGQKLLYVPTDKNGNFSIQLPVIDQNEKLKVEFSLWEPNGVMKHYLKNGTLVKLEGTYSLLTKAIRTIDAEWNQMGKIYCQFTPNNLSAEVEWCANLAGWKLAMAEQMNYKATEQVTATINIPFESAFAVGDYKLADNVLVDVTVGIDTYAALVKNGKIDMTVYYDGPSAIPSVKIKQISLPEKEFKHFDIDRKVNYLSGTYQKSFVDKKDGSAWNELGDVYCSFMPNADAENWNDWFTHLAGWVRMSECNATKNVTGTIYRAEEKEFGVGTYELQPNTLVCVEVPMGSYFNAKYVAATDANGKFSIPVHYNTNNQNLPLTGVNVKPYFAVNPVEFVHYTDFDKQEVVEGTFTNYFTSPFIKGYTPWNECGDFYFKSSYVDVLDYAGWVNKEFEVKDGYKSIVAISGEIKRAVEKVEGTMVMPKWELDKGKRLVAIYIDGVKYSVVANNGKFALPARVEQIESECMLRVVPESGRLSQLDAFIHYHDNFDTSISETIYGYYYPSANYNRARRMNIVNDMVKLNESVKMLFMPTADALGNDSEPDGWELYKWDSSLE